jgi:Holliday junction resolvase RusA-like endonuclease
MADLPPANQGDHRQRQQPLTRPARTHHPNAHHPPEQSAIGGRTSLTQNQPPWVADVLQYLIRLADVLQVDLAEAIRTKVQLNETRFPRSAVPTLTASTPGGAGIPDKEPFLILEITGHPASYSSAAEGPWKAAVRAEIARKHATSRDTRFGVRIAFRTRVPANANEAWDIDNLVKPTLDAMEGVLGLRPWKGSPQAADDRVDYLEASKRTVRDRESPGAPIEVYDLGPGVTGR